MFVDSLTMVPMGSVQEEVTPFVVCNCQLHHNLCLEWVIDRIINAGRRITGGSGLCCRNDDTMFDLVK